MTITEARINKKHLLLSVLVTVCIAVQSMFFTVGASDTQDTVSPDFSNVALVLKYGDKSGKYTPGETSASYSSPSMVYEATGVIDGKFVTVYCVHALIHRKVKVILLADCVNTFYSMENGIFVKNESLSKQDITDRIFVESVIYHDFFQNPADCRDM